MSSNINNPTPVILSPNKKYFNTIIDRFNELELKFIVNNLQKDIQGFEPDYLPYISIDYLICYLEGKRKDFTEIGSCFSTYILAKLYIK